MKKKSLTFNILLYIVILFCFVAFNSCRTSKSITYFQNVPRDTIITDAVNNVFERRILKNDLLDINIISTDPVYTALFNGTPNSTATQPGAKNTDGLLVDNDGNISMYKLGTIHVEGLTRTELRQKLEKDLEPYLKN